MSEHEPRWGSFVTGVAVGVVLGLLFAPETGDELRGKLGRRLAGMRDRVLNKIAEEDEPSA